MKSKHKLILLFFVTGLILFLLYDHYQPKCEPCELAPCPPCTSDKQVFIFRSAIIIAVSMTGYLLYLQFFTGNKKDND